MSDDVASIPSTEGPAERLGRDEIGTLFLFEALDRGQLEWLSEHSHVDHRAAGELVYAEGEPATSLFLLLRGTASMRRNVRGDDVELIRTDQRGAYAGATQAYLDQETAGAYGNSLHAVSDCDFLVISADAFAWLMRTWFPMAMHLLEGLWVGLRNTNEIIGQRERLLALGQLSAGLTHELNNPAAAAVRATGALRERVSAMRHKLAALASGRLDAAMLGRLTELQEEAAERVAKAPQLTALDEGDREDEISDWLDVHDITGSYDVAPVLVQAGLDVEFLDRFTLAVPADCVDSALRWVAYTVETELLMNEISDAVTRVSTLVGAAKQYSQLDRAPHQVADVHDGLASTLVMLGGKLGRDIRLVKEFDRSLPPVPGYPAELNQVWTNLVDNALAAMQGKGTLTVRTERDGDQVLVSIGDTGPGVPDELRQRVFEPFFTTKGVGEGTGLGLDISYRIVVRRHGGDLRLRSVPGDTWFEVRLPLQASPAG